MGECVQKRRNVMARAKPIIFIHGLFQGPFKPGVAQLLSPNPVSIPDLPGYGTNQPASPDDVSVSAAADFICAHIHELGYDQAHLVGHSVGGAVGVVVASRYTEV